MEIWSHEFVIRKIKMAHNWFGRICVVFSTSRRRSRKRSANLLPVSPMKIFLHSVQVLHIDLNCVRNKGTSFASCVFACEGSWLIVRLQCAPN